MHHDEEPHISMTEFQVIVEHFEAGQRALGEAIRANQQKNDENFAILREQIAHILEDQTGLRIGQNRLEGRMDKLEGRMEKLEKEVKDGFNEVKIALQDKASKEDLAATNARVTRLEQNAA